jgi:hypothetical protein
MNTSDWSIWVVFILIAGLLVWNFTRRRKSGGMNLDVALGIISNVEDCIRTIEIRLADPQSKKKFQDASWRAFSKRTAFLGPELVATLTEAFTLVADFNQRIDTARKNKMMATLQDMPVESLKAPMLKAKAGLQAWMKSGYQDELKNRRGCMGF